MSTQTGPTRAELLAQNARLIVALNASSVSAPHKTAAIALCNASLEAHDAGDIRGSVRLVTMAAALSNANAQKIMDQVLRALTFAMTELEKRGAV